MPECTKKALYEFTEVRLESRGSLRPKCRLTGSSLLEETHATRLTRSEIEEVVLILLFSQLLDLAVISALL